MMNKATFGLAFAALMAVSLAACGAKELSGTIPEPGWEHLYESGGMKLAVPSEYDSLVNVTVPGEVGKDGILFTVAEKASVEAAKKQGAAGDGAGELFEIGRVSESELNARRCYDMSGQEVFARDGDGNYYIYYHPTDVRFTRESYEGVGDEGNEDWKQWTKLNEWANNRVRVAFIAANSGLSAVSYGNTDPEVYLARAAYAPGESYTIEVPGCASLAANSVDAAPFVERLTRDASFETANSSDTPKGEYATLRFPNADYRFDFFLAPDGESYIRQIWNNGQNTMLYKAQYYDGTTRAFNVVKEWYDALAAANDAGNASLGYTPDDLVGTWAEKIAHRGVITVAKSPEDGKYDVRIDWSGSASEKGIWEMTAEPVGEGGMLVYQNGKYLIRTYTSDTEYTDAVQYENGTGAFTLNSAFEIMWEDETGHAGDNCVFVNTGSAWRYALTTETRTEEEKNDAGVLLATTSYELPTLAAIGGDGSQEPPEAQRRVCESFNKRVAELSQSLKTVKPLAEGAQEQYSEMGEEFRKDFPAHCEELRVSAHRRSGDLLEVSFQTYGFWGGAHGGSSFYTWHYDLAEGAFVELSDLTDRPEELNRMIADEIIDAIGQEGNADGYFEDYAETIRAKDRFGVSFGTDAMNVDFEQYEIAPYAAGMPSFQISYEKLAPFLNERGQRLLAEVTGA